MQLLSNVEKYSLDRARAVATQEDVGRNVGRHPYDVIASPAGAGSSDRRLPLSREPQRHTRTCDAHGTVTSSLVAGMAALPTCSRALRGARE